MRPRGYRGRRGRPPIRAPVLAEYDRDVISSPWLLLGIGAAAASMMVVLWLVQVRIGDATHVDVGWAYGVGGLAVLDAALGDGRRCTAAARRPARRRLESPPRDVSGRQSTRRQARGRPLPGAATPLGASRAAPLLRLLPGAGGLRDGVLASVRLRRRRRRPRSPRLAWAGAALAIVAIAGEVARRPPARRLAGRPGQQGHDVPRRPLEPLPASELLLRVAPLGRWAVIALGSPNGWVVLVVPGCCSLFWVTGIPETEAQALRSRGDDYRRVPGRGLDLRAVVSRGARVLMWYERADRPRRAARRRDPLFGDRGGCSPSGCATRDAGDVEAQRQQMRAFVAALKASPIAIETGRRQPTALRGPGRVLRARARPAPEVLGRYWPAG